MEIVSSIKDRSGKEFKLVYRESDPLADLEGKVIQSVQAFCFYGVKLVLVYTEAKGRWTVPGGRVESGEDHKDATVREVQEETNMKVLHRETIGYQDIYEPKGVIRQVRSFCLVEPIGDFKYDSGGGDITAIKLIDPERYKDYFDWGEVGDRLMERSLRMLKSYVL